MKLFGSILALGFAIFSASSIFAMEGDDSKSIQDVLRREEDRLVRDWNNFFATNPELKTLKIKKLKIHGTMGLENLTEQLVKHPSLMALDLSHGGISGDGWADAIKTVLKQNPNITSMDLSHNNLCGDMWTAELRDGLLGNTSLRTINLSSCKLSDLTFDNRIDDILRHNDSLVIDLSDYDSISILTLLIFLKTNGFSTEDIRSRLKLGLDDETLKSLNII
jgi:hypothetical protein